MDIFRADEMGQPEQKCNLHERSLGEGRDRSVGGVLAGPIMNI